jgi:hypothetical protein
MDQGPRYAIYFVPARDSDLYRFGSSVLGYDCYSGEAVPQPDEFKSDADRWRRLVREPRRYGFHATLKAPFHLLPSCSEAQLVSALHSFSGLDHAVAAIAPTIESVSDFAAVVPMQQQAALDALAAKCATIFDAFRAPISPQQRARRVAMGLSHDQIRNLDRWGYPFMFADFRFHMTLTGGLEAGERAEVVATLRRVFARTCGDQTIAVDRLALLKQDSAGTAFRVVSDAALGTAR